MKRLILTILTSAVMFITADAQSNLKKIYDESIDPMSQIDKAVAKAEKEGRFVICQVGGNWCRWCLMFADYITKDSEISALIDKNFEYIHVNYNPRERSDEAKMKKAEEMLERLGNSAFLYSWFSMATERSYISRIQACLKKATATTSPR